MATSNSFLKHFTLTTFISLVISVWIFSLPVKNSIYQIATILIIVLFVTTLALQKEERQAFIGRYLDVIVTFSLIPLTMLLANLVNGIVDAEPWADALKYLYRHTLILLALLYFYETDRLSKTVFTLACLAALSLYAADGCVEFFSTFAAGGSKPLKGLTFNQNIFGLVMLSAFVMSCICFFESYSGTRKRSLYFNAFALLCISVFLLLLILSHSRAAWISAAAFFVAMSVCQPKHLKQQALIAALLLIISGLLVYSSEQLQHRFMLLVQLNDSHRFEAWLGAVDAIIRKPLFGYGLADFDTVVTATIKSVHNSTLEILLGTGIVGLLAFSFAIYVTAMEVGKSRKFIYFAAMLSFIVISQFDHSIFNSKTFNSILTIFTFYVFSSRKERYGSLTRVTQLNR